MTHPRRRPTTALFATASSEVLQALTERKDRLFVGSELMRGKGEYLALVDYEPGSPHDERDIEVARALSADCDGPVYMVSFGEDDERITTCERGALLSDAEADDAPDPEQLARELGLGGIFPPASPEPRSFMLVENASVEAVETAIGPTLKRMGKVLRLEARGADVLGWELIADGMTPAALDLLRPRSRQVTALPDGRYALDLPPEAPEAAVQALSAAGGRVVSLNPQRHTLEDYFVQHVAQADTREAAL